MEVNEQENIKKNPGWSSIEVDKVFYRFVASNESSGVGAEANKELEQVMEKLKDKGYMPEFGNVLHDIEEEEKQGAIVRHSEKLTVAFGIARIHVGRTIRIVKNLRECRDCHTVMKMISKVYEREIAVRDRSRFHSFKDGFCSCGDYWRLRAAFILQNRTWSYGIAYLALNKGWTARADPNRSRPLLINDGPSKKTRGHIYHEQLQYYHN